MVILRFFCAFSCSSFSFWYISAHFLTWASQGFVVAPFAVCGIVLFIYSPGICATVGAVPLGARRPLLAQVGFWPSGASLGSVWLMSFWAILWLNMGSGLRGPLLAHFGRSWSSLLAQFNFSWPSLSLTVPGLLQRRLAHFGRSWPSEGLFASVWPFLAFCGSLAVPGLLGCRSAHFGRSWLRGVVWPSLAVPGFLGAWPSLAVPGRLRPLLVQVVRSWPSGPRLAQVGRS